MWVDSKTGIEKKHRTIMVLVKYLEAKEEILFIKVGENNTLRKA
jgi:hypothetical protein